MLTIGRKQTLMNKLNYIKMDYVRSQNYSQASSIKNITDKLKTIDISDELKIQNFFIEIEKMLKNTIFDEYSIKIMNELKKCINNDIRKVKLLKIEKLYIF